MPLREPRPTSQIWVIAYDICDDKRRTKTARLLQSKGERIQKSVFELDVTPEILAAVAEQIARLIHPREDRVDFIPTCGACTRRWRSLGRSRPPRSESWEVI